MIHPTEKEEKGGERKKNVFGSVDIKEAIAPERSLGYIYIFSSVIVGYMVGSYPLRMVTCIELVVSFSSWGKNLGSLSMIDRSLIVSLDKRAKKTLPKLTKYGDVGEVL